MSDSPSTCAILRTYLSTSTSSGDDRGKTMLRRRLGEYFFWKGALGKMSRNLDKGKKPATNFAARGLAAATKTPSNEEHESAALKRKKEYRRGQQPSNKRRRVRPGAAQDNGNARPRDHKGADSKSLETEAAEMAQMCVFYLLCNRFSILD
jgi:DNA excision repair protein ERCC-4